MRYQKASEIKTLSAIPSRPDAESSFQSASLRSGNHAFFVGLVLPDSAFLCWGGGCGQHYKNKGKKEASHLPACSMRVSQTL